MYNIIATLTSMKDTTDRPNLPKMVFNGPALFESDLAAFEKRHKVSLPLDYREFMLEYNGGSPNPKIYGLFVTVQKFYSISEEGVNLDQMCQCIDWRTAYPQGILVIGRDIGGSKILLATRGAKTGTIYFLDREETLRPRTGHVEIAASFSDLMGDLVSD